MEGAKVDPDNGHATGLVETGGERKEGSLFKFRSLGSSIWPAGRRVTVKTGSSRSGTDERGKCDNVGLSAACPSNKATICSVVVAVA